MANKIKRIGVLTSGGDAPGMNAAVRAVTRKAITSGLEVVAIYEGYKGLIEDNTKLFKMRDVSNIINHGGTILYSARSKRFLDEQGQNEALETCRKHKIDGLVVIGGDGTFRGAVDLSRLGVPVIGIPGTIDNDITSTDYTIGYDTAMNTAIQMVDNLRDTCESHFRCNVVEIMGNNAGYIALNVGLATGAAQIVVNEVPIDEVRMFEEIIRGKEHGKRHYIIMVSEGVKGYAEDIAKRIPEVTGIDTRFTRLGHVVRGGSPTVRDRVIATQMGVEAVELLLQGKTNLVVCLRDRQLTSMDMEYAFTLDKMYKNKLTGDDLRPYSITTIAEMREFCRAKKEAFEKLYYTALDVSK